MRNISNIHICLSVSVFKQDLFGMFQIENKLDNIERKLMDRRPEDLRDEIESLKKKTEQNRKMARDAREAADSALQNTTDAAQVRYWKVMSKSVYNYGYYRILSDNHIVF